MLINEIEKRVIYLSGYLNGLQDLDGDIRDFFADALLLEAKYANAKIDLEELYSGNNNVSFSEPISIDNWNCFLEQDLIKIILSRPFDSDSIITSNLIDRREYCAFRIMDQIGFIVEDNFKGSSLFKVNTLIKEDDMETSVVFYLIHISDISQYLVLRFCTSR